MYTLSGGALSVFFVLAAAQQAHAEPRDTAGGRIGVSAKNTSGSANAAERRQGNEEKGKRQAKATEDRRQAENRRRVDSGPSGRNEQTERRSRKARSDPERQKQERRKVDDGPSGNKDQRERLARKRQGEKKAEEGRKQEENRRRVDSGPSGRNEQTGKRARQARWEKSSPEDKRRAVEAEQGRRKAEEERRQVENRDRVDRGPSGRNEQTGKRARQARWENLSPENKRQAELGRQAAEQGRRKAEEANRRRAEDLRRQVEERKRIDSGPSGRNEQTGKRARQARWENLSPENKRQAELGRQAAAEARRKAEEARQREENKSWREKVGDTLRGAEEAFERKLAEDRAWAEDQINQERNAPDKSTDLATGARRFSAGVYKSVYDNVHAAGEYMEKLDRASKGDQQAQREVEQDARNAVEGVKRTATDAWNDPKGSFDKVVEAGRKAVDNFRRAPISGAGELVGDLVGAGKVTKSAKAVAGGDSGRSPEPGSGPDAGRPDTPAPQGSPDPPGGSAGRAGGEGSGTAAGGGDRGAPPAGTGANRGGDRGGESGRGAADNAGPRGDAGSRGGGESRRGTAGSTGDRAPRGDADRDGESRRGGAGDAGSRGDGQSRRGAAGSRASRDDSRDSDDAREASGRRDDDSRRAAPANPARERARTADNDDNDRPRGAIPYHGGDSDFRPLPVRLGDEPVGPPAWTLSETVHPGAGAEFLGVGGPRAVRWDVEPMHRADDPDSSLVRYEGGATAGHKEHKKPGGKFSAERKFAVDGSASAGVSHGFFVKPLGQDVKPNTAGWSAEASVKGGIGQKGSVSYDTGKDKPVRARVKGDGFAGAEAKATARSNRDALLLLGEFFAGLKAGLRGGVDFRGIGISANVEGMAGVGGLAKFGFERGPNGMHLGGYLGGSLGLGGGAGVDITFDRKKGKQTVQDGAEAINRIGNRAALANAVDRADAGNKTTPRKKGVPVKKPNKGKHATKGNKKRKG
ncbi:hypothetical protein [Amycolatopsis suaedae]|uniref:Uncharacterized protein n=1 Tax=Amycolatopsis suaedae TaxID=2510978 RepID=A0A4Q7J2Y9_9PSEU|nr:hypothetical protein [Amycolatopsis suaedae]RZQ60946.1 hypothetical protein EWH70_26015 [Amycolatopsis suaedae]